MNNRIINLIVVLIILGTGSWFGFKSYLKNNKAESEVEKSETTATGDQEKTEAGVILNSFDHLEGSYTSVKLDPPTTEILFETYGTTATQGTFKNLEVSANFNGIENSVITVTIDAASIYTAESTRDKHLKGDGFFNVELFSTITFNSNQIIKGDSSYIAKGDITFLGNTKPFEVPFLYQGSASGKENTEVFEGKFEFNPITHGMNGDAGEKVTISFYTELKKD